MLGLMENGLQMLGQTLGLMEKWPSNVRVYGKLGLILEGYWKIRPYP